VHLSKDYLAGTAQEDWIPLRSSDYYRDRRIDLLLQSRVSSLDTTRRRIVLENGKALEFGALLLATEADPVHLPIEGATDSQLHYLRTFADSKAIIAKAASAKGVVIVGASFIGLAPDDRKAVLSMDEPLAALWVYDLTRNTRTRLTFGHENSSHPVWSPDGSQIAYTQGGGAANDAGPTSSQQGIQRYRRGKTAPVAGPGKRDAAGIVRLVARWPLPYVSYRYLRHRRRFRPLDSPALWRPQIVFLRYGTRDQLYAQFSPDGRWVAYSSNETGRNEVYVPLSPRPARSGRCHRTAGPCRVGGGMAQS
jgi:hypothetical protein